MAARELQRQALPAHVLRGGQGERPGGHGPGAETARQEKPKLIICGASAYSRDWDYAAFRAIADEVGAVLLADISHPAGPIAAKLLNDPCPTATW